MEMHAEEPAPEQYPTPRAAVLGVPAYSVVQGQALDAREDLVKCASCPAYLIKGQMVCFSCGAQVAEKVKHQNFLFIIGWPGLKPSCLFKSVLTGV